MQTAASAASQLLSILEPLQSIIKVKRWRVVPSSFDAMDDALRAFPLERNWQWHTLEAHIKNFKPETLIVQLPLFWQLEPYVHAAARSAEVPVCIIEPQNYPLDKASVLFAGADGVLAEVTEASALADYLHAQNIALPQYWILIHTVDAPQFTIPELLAKQSVAQEVHLVPGVPLLEQCTHAAKAKQNQFHQSDIFEWHTNNGQLSIASKSLVFPLDTIALPFLLADAGACACGKRLYVRQ